MALTPSQKSAAFRKRRKAKFERLARYEAALREIAERSVIDAMLDPHWATIVAKDALEVRNDQPQRPPRWPAAGMGRG